ncbi:MAG: hypothetical protein QHI48_03340 [Bacteroidota bacterium]|nr:hypothetical protein [Bacteroidota bacterium]
MGRMNGDTCNPADSGHRPPGEGSAEQPLRAEERRHASEATTPLADGLEMGERRFQGMDHLLHFYVLVLVLTLPVTALCLWLLAVVDIFPNMPDIHGLIAVSIGILGLLIFYIFLYKYQITAPMDAKRRILFMIFHVFVSLFLFLFLIWAGFKAPWKMKPLWGNYELNTAVRSWIISIFVLGFITLLGSVFDSFRKSMMREKP